MWQHRTVVKLGVTVVSPTKNKKSPTWKHDVLKHEPVSARGTHWKPSQNIPQLKCALANTRSKLNKYKMIQSQSCSQLANKHHLSKWKY